MILFSTKAKLIEYTNKTGALPGKYVVINDETMQNKKAVYSFAAGELILESGGTKDIHWLSSVNLYTDIATTHPSPLGMDAVIVNTDETRGNNKTWYLFNGTSWIYKGAYQKRETQRYFSEANTRASILSGNLTLPWEYVVGNDELEAYLDGVLVSERLIEVGDVGFTSKIVKFNIDIPMSTSISIRKMVPNIDDEPRTNDEVYVNAFKHNYNDIEKYIKYEKSSVIFYDTLNDAMNDTLLLKENQVIRTHGHTTKNDGKGRYWILETTDKDFAYRNKANTFFINRLIGADEKQIGEMFPLATGLTAPPETIFMSGQIANRSDFKRIWAWAVATGRVVTEAEWVNNTGCFSSGNGSTTFRFPDPRGEFIRSWNGNHATIDVGRLVGSKQLGTMIFDHTTQAVTVHAANADVKTSEYGAMTIHRAGGQSGYNVAAQGHLTRPRNIAEPYYIKV